jgi:hypothetical protein
MCQVGRQWELRLEKANYEANLARRRFIAVEPENRLAARNLEREWNDKLAAIEQLNRDHEVSTTLSPKTLTPLERCSILNLAHDLRNIWNAETTTQVERKQLLRFLIKDITLTRDGRAAVHISVRWQTGAITPLYITLKVGNDVHKTDPIIIDLGSRVAKQV